jgi:hypothetical protein
MNRRLFLTATLAGLLALGGVGPLTEEARAQKGKKKGKGKGKRKPRKAHSKHHRRRRRHRRHGIIDLFVRW